MDRDPCDSRDCRDCGPGSGGSPASCRASIFGHDRPHGAELLMHIQGRPPSLGLHWPSNVPPAACDAAADDRSRRPIQNLLDAATVFRAQAQSLFFARRQTLVSCRRPSCQQSPATQIVWLSALFIFLLLSALPARCTECTPSRQLAARCSVYPLAANTECALSRWSLFSCLIQQVDNHCFQIRIYSSNLPFIIHSHSARLHHFCSTP